MIDMLASRCNCSSCRAIGRIMLDRRNLPGFRRSAMLVTESATSHNGSCWGWLAGTAANATPHDQWAIPGALVVSFAWRNHHRARPPVRALFL